jgi:hypothetical protein
VCARVAEPGQALDREGRAEEPGSGREGVGVAEEYCAGGQGLLRQGNTEVRTDAGRLSARQRDQRELVGPARQMRFRM